MMPISLSLENIAAGFIKIAVDNMAKAVEKISIAKGVDPSQSVLSGFGGAAGQHVCQLADKLGINEVVVHPEPTSNTRSSFVSGWEWRAIQVWSFSSA